MKLMRKYYTYFFLIFIGASFTGCVYNTFLTQDKKHQPPASTKDLLAHKNNSLEWWYFSNHVKDSAGTAYGIMVSLFKKYVPVAGEVLMLNYLVTDEKQQTFKSWVDYAKLPKKQLRGSTLNYKEQGKNGDWQISQLADSSWVVNIYPKNNMPSLQLKASINKPIIAEGQGGYIDFGKLGKAGYLSYTNMNITGQLSNNAFTGKGWFDKQWNCGAITKPYADWDWMGIQFENNTELMIFKMLDKKNKTSTLHATYINEVGAVQYFSGNDISLESTHNYMAQSTIMYPTTWYFNIAPLKLNGKISASFNNHETRLSVLGRSFMNYWEGKCSVQATQNNAPLNGAGFLEMTKH
jgi:predicted secreted hydrolase